MMFGGKQVVVCGYGEVRASCTLRPAEPGRPLHGFTPRGSAVPCDFPPLGTAPSWQKRRFSFRDVQSLVLNIANLNRKALNTLNIFNYQSAQRRRSAGALCSCSVAHGRVLKKKR